VHRHLHGAADALAVEDAPDFGQGLGLGFADGKPPSTVRAQLSGMAFLLSAALRMSVTAMLPRPRKGSLLSCKASISRATMTRAAP
jgi:hypothetical protein